MEVLVLSPAALYKRTVKALRDLTGFAREVVGLEEFGVGIVENPREYVRWLAKRVDEGTAEDALLTLVGGSGALVVRVGGDTYHVLIGPAYRSEESVKAALAHELAHMLQHQLKLFPKDVPRPAGAVRSVLLPLEVGAEELVLRELPEIGKVRIRMAQEEAREWRRTGDPILDLENALVAVPIRLAARRLGLDTSVQEPSIEDPELRKVREKLVKLARGVDPWDQSDVERYTRKSVSILLDWLLDQDRHHSTSDSNNRKPSSEFKRR
ncbi:hypothetical protein [Methanopyrus kandleri]